MQSLIYTIESAGEPAAGITPFTAEVVINLDSDPGGEPGEFAEHVKQALDEWFDSGPGTIAESTGHVNTIDRCPECGSRDLSWHCDAKNNGGATDGRICMREVGVIFYLGCNECSETLAIIKGDAVAALLTRMRLTSPIDLTSKPTPP